MYLQIISHSKKNVNNILHIVYVLFQEVLYSMDEELLYHGIKAFVALGCKKDNLRIAEEYLTQKRFIHRVIGPVRERQYRKSDIFVLIGRCDETHLVFPNEDNMQRQRAIDS